MTSEEQAAAKKVRHDRDGLVILCAALTVALLSALWEVVSDKCYYFQ